MHDESYRDLCLGAWPSVSHLFGRVEKTSAVLMNAKSVVCALSAMRRKLIVHGLHSHGRAPPASQHRPNQKKGSLAFVLPHRLPV